MRISWRRRYYVTVQAGTEKRARFASVSGRGVLVTHAGAYTKAFLRDVRPSKTFLCKLPWFVLRSFFSLIKTIYPKVSTKLLPNDAKSSLPVVAPYFITFTSNGKTRICTTWPSFPYTCRLLFITSTHKLVVSRNFVIHKNRFELFLSVHFLF